MRKFTFSLVLFAFLSVQAQTTQTIVLQQGWNIFSSYLNPTEPDMFNIVEELINNGSFVVVLDEEGNMLNCYIPLYSYL